MNRPTPPCPRCGAIATRITPGKGPHAAREDCAGCGRFIRWVSKREMADVEEAVLTDALQRWANKGRRP